MDEEHLCSEGTLSLLTKHHLTKNRELLEQLPWRCQSCLATHIGTAVCSDCPSSPGRGKQLSSVLASLMDLLSELEEPPCPIPISLSTEAMVRMVLSPHGVPLTLLLHRYEEIPDEASCECREGGGGHAWQACELLQAAPPPNLTQEDEELRKKLKQIAIAEAGEKLNDTTMSELYGIRVTELTNGRLWSTEEDRDISHLKTSYPGSNSPPLAIRARNASPRPRLRIIRGTMGRGRGRTVSPETEELRRRLRASANDLHSWGNMDSSPYSPDLLSLFPNLPSVTTRPRPSSHTGARPRGSISQHSTPIMHDEDTPSTDTMLHEIPQQHVTITPMNDMHDEEATSMIGTVVSEMESLMLTPILVPMTMGEGGGGGHAW